LHLPIAPQVLAVDRRASLRTPLFRRCEEGVDDGLREARDANRPWAPRDRGPETAERELAPELLIEGDDEDRSSFEPCILGDLERRVLRLSERARECPPFPVVALAVDDERRGVVVLGEIVRGVLKHERARDGWIGAGGCED